MPVKKAPVVTPDMRVTEEIERRFGLIVAGPPEGIGVSFEALGFEGVSIVENMEHDKRRGETLVYGWQWFSSHVYHMFIFAVSFSCSH